MKYKSLRETLRPYFETADDAVAAKLLESEYSFDATRSALYAALRANRTAPDGSYMYRYIRDVYSNYVVYYEEIGYDDAGKLYKSEYSIAADGTATLGNRVQVRIEYVTVATSADLSESSAIHETGVPLKERALRPDGTMQIKIIGPGKGSSGYYSREVIERDVPKVFPKGTHMMANHQTAEEEALRPEGEIENLAAVFVSQPYYLEESEAPEGEGAYVDAKPFADYAPMLEDKAEAIGVSINAFGDLVEGNINGETVPVVERITFGKTVDFVTKAGRDGKIVSLKEAKRLKNAAVSPGDNVSVSIKEATIPNPTTTTPEETQLEKLTEAQLQESLTSAQTEIATLKRQALESSATRVLESTLADEKYKDLPAPAKARITESLKSSPVEKDGALDVEAYTAKIAEAVEAEVKYLSEASGNAGDTVRGCGGGDATGLKESGTPREVAAARASAGL